MRWPPPPNIDPAPEVFFKCASYPEEREREREREAVSHTYAHRQTDRHTHTHTHKEKERQRERERHITTRTDVHGEKLPTGAGWTERTGPREAVRPRPRRPYRRGRPSYPPGRGVVDGSGADAPAAHAPFH